MEIYINNNEPEEKTSNKHKKHRILYNCVIIFFIFVLILSIPAFYFKDYFSVVPTLFKLTNKNIPRSQAEQTQKYAYNNKELINILLLGSDNDSKFVSTNVLTQTIIIVSINTKTSQVTMVSIPRDFWVSIEGVSGGYGKIDEASGLGGLGLTRQTIEKDFGIHIDYYAWIGLNGFIKVIDTLGGIDIDVNHPVLDDAYPNDVTGNDPYSAIRVYIPAGPQHLDGTKALEYVRSRHGDLQGDFGRSVRQQQVLLNIKQKIQSGDFVSKIPQLSNELQDSIRTDMTILQITSLAPVLTTIKPTDIHRYILSPPDYSTNGKSPDGTKDIVIPDYKKINDLFNRIFAI